MPEDEVKLIAAAIGLDIRGERNTIDDLWPLLDCIRQEGTTTVLKIDGERDRNQYTAIVYGGGLQDSTYRVDASTWEEAICTIVVWYAKQVWGWQGGALTRAPPRLQ